MAPPALARVLYGDAPGRHRTAVLRRIRQGVTFRALSLRLLRYRAVRLEDEVRLRDRMAELLASDLVPQRGRGRGPAFRHARSGNQLRTLRRAPRPCLQRRPAADRPALLHELGRAPLRPARNLKIGRAHV